MQYNSLKHKKTLLLSETVGFSVLNSETNRHLECLTNVKPVIELCDIVMIYNGTNHYYVKGSL